MDITESGVVLLYMQWLKLWLRSLCHFDVCHFYLVAVVMRESSINLDVSRNVSILVQCDSACQCFYMQNSLSPIIIHMFFILKKFMPYNIDKPGTNGAEANPLVMQCTF